MNKGERWKRLFESKGWIKDNVVAGGEDEKLHLTIPAAESRSPGNSVTLNSALYSPDDDILCYEDGSSTIFFHWDDIIQVRLEHGVEKRRWL